MVCSAALLLASLAASTQGGAAPRVEVSLQVLEASNEAGGKPTSRAARDLAATLSFKSYKTLSQERHELAQAEWSTSTLPNGATISLSPKAVDKVLHTVRLQVSVHEGEQHLDADYTVRDGGTVFVSAGKNGNNVLVLAIIPRAK